MEQSMFSRLIRLKMPFISLNKQGRCRPSFLPLFGWRYPQLENLESIVKDKQYAIANSGFKFESQFIEVGDFNGKGESCPMPYFYQNLAEAEYIIATYMYMVLIGYDPEKITILTTYNGQKFLIRDIFRQKCSWNQIFKKPKITTVDKYQGRQNDYILLSMVRTEAVGYLKDPRRTVVALSRARLGLYIFGRYDLFAECNELSQALQNFQETPKELDIVTAEKFPTKRESGEFKKLKSQTIANFQEMYKVVQKMLEEKL